MSPEQPLCGGKYVIRSKRSDLFHVSRTLSHLGFLLIIAAPAFTSLPPHSCFPSAWQFIHLWVASKQRKPPDSLPLPGSSNRNPSSFLTDYFHTFTILIICCYFTVKAFTVDEIGSIGNLFELVQSASKQNPVAGNEDGSYLTMASKGVILSAASPQVGY